MGRRTEGAQDGRGPGRLALVALVAAAVVSGPLAYAASAPLNDLLALGEGSGQEIARVPAQRNPAPPLDAAPRAVCAPGSRPEPGIQGRVPTGAARDGLWCNARIVGRHGRSGGFKVHRLVDRAGRECAIYDTALLYPANAFKFDAESLGVQVLDMSDPARPRGTAVLTELPMLSPHESLEVNERRGLIAAVLGNPSTYPGLVSIYDASEDCRRPVLQSTRLNARFGHESGFSEDGRTFYATGTAVDDITAIDVTHPKAPEVLWHGKVTSHGMSLSPDGNRGYLADPDGELAVVDTSEIQARKPDPQVREISRLTWNAASIPQNALPFTVGGHPYVLEFDEYTAGTTSGGDRDTVGAGRIIDLGDETRPRVIGNLRLQVNQPADHRAASGDPGAASPVQGYAAHYCDLDSRVDPTVVACSFITSGLRVFDISDLQRPREIAYVVAPTKAVSENLLQESSFAMSKPEIIGDRREIWYSDGASGFYVVRVDDAAWPARRPACAPRARRFVALRTKGRRVRRASATLGGRRVPVVRRRGRLGVVVDLRAAPAGDVVLTGAVRTRRGGLVRTTRTFRVCAA
jgi:hypothetical protein